MSALDSADMSLIYSSRYYLTTSDTDIVVRTIFVSVRLVGGACKSPISAVPRNEYYYAISEEYSQEILETD